MLLQTLHVQIEMMNLNFQVTLLVKKGPTPQQDVGTPFPPHCTSGFQSFFNRDPYTNALWPCVPMQNSNNANVMQLCIKCLLATPRLTTIGLDQWSSTFFVQSPPLRELCLKVVPYL